MQNSSTTAKVLEEKEKQISFTVEEAPGANGTEGSYAVLSSDKYRIVLFPARVPLNPDAKARVLYNARINVTTSEGVFGFNTSVKELTENGELFIGGKSSMQGHHAIVSEWVKAKTALDKGKSYERSSIPTNLYREIMAIIRAYVKG
jgi:hypothetical protein